MTNIPSLFFGIVSTVAVIMAMQFKSIKLSLVFQVICNVAGALSFIATGAVSGCGLSVIGVTQAFVFLLFRLKNKEPASYLAWIFAAAFLGCSAMTFEKSIDILSMLAALTCAFGLAQKKSSLYRIFMLLNGIFWLSYDIFSGAYGMIPSHSITVISSVIGIIRIDINQSSKKAKA